MTCDPTDDVGRLADDERNITGTSTRPAVRRSSSQNRQAAVSGQVDVGDDQFRRDLLQRLAAAVGMSWHNGNRSPPPVSTAENRGQHLRLIVDRQDRAVQLPPVHRSWPCSRVVPSGVGLPRGQNSVRPHRTLTGIFDAGIHFLHSR